MAKATKKTIPLTSEPRPACADQYFGHWLVEPSRLTERVELFRAGAIAPRPRDENENEKKPEPLYQTSGGIAIIPIQGLMIKGDSSFGGTTSTVRLRRAIRMAANDSDVRGIMYHIESPGGTVDGAYELADDIKAAADLKPSMSYIADLGASAAYLAASQTDRIISNRTAMVGSLGTLAKLVDESGALEKMGLKVHVVSTAPMKGAGADGKVTDAMIAETQRMVNSLNAHFMSAVKEGRGWTDKKTAELFDGRVHTGTEAQSLGLVDSVSSFDGAMETLITEVNTMTDQEYAAYNAANPDKLQAAASGLIQAAQKDGHDAGVKSERDRFGAIIGVKGIDLTIAAKHITSGGTKAEALDDVNGQLSMRLADAEKKAATPVTGTKPVGVSALPSEMASAPDGRKDPKALAEWEFDNGKTSQKAADQWLNREAYVGFRVRELKTAQAA